MAILFLTSLVLFPDFADIVLSVHHIAAGIIVISTIKKHHSFQINWYTLAMIPVLGGVMLLAPAIEGYLRMAMVILMLIAILNYFVLNVRQWHRIQLILDISVMLIVLLGLTSALLFTQIDTVGLSALSWTILVVVVVCDELSLLSVMVMMTTVRAKLIHLRLYYIVIGMTLRIGYDMLYVSNNYTLASHDRIFGNVLSLIAFSLFAIGSVMEQPEEVLKDEFERRSTHANFHKTRLIFFIGLAPVILFIAGLINLHHFAIILAAIIFYLLLSFYVQKTAMMERLIREDQFLKDKLEALVDDRTIALKKANAALYDKSTIDSLTGLYNRHHFIELIEKEILIPDNRFSVFFMDLDRFKIINDLHGHDMGDLVLQIIAERFRTGVCDKCAFARVGGDEFAILYRSDDTTDLEQLSKSILDILSEPVIVDDYQFYVGISIGISRYPKEATTVKQLMKNADIAMYHAKSDEKIDKYVLYTANLIEKIERRNHIELLLREANFEKDFELFYQPKFATATGVLIGMEALIRWQHADEGFISPAEFIPIAEETGIILKLSDWVFATAMARIKTINDAYNTELVMSMNVSPLSLDSISFLPNLSNMIKKINVNPKWIELEITEHSAMNTATRMEELFTAIGGLGVQISIDDFGTGYSSLNYIKRFDIDILKIAKELIDHIETSNNDRLIVKAIVMMAKGMGLKTIAEGVETVEQLRILEDLECDAIQGYLKGRPVPAQLFDETYLKDL